MMRATRTILALAILMLLAACSHASWTGRYMSGPMKRRLASEQRAMQALDAFFEASTDLVGLSAVDIHDDCLLAYWEDGPMTPQRRRRIDDDRVCSYVLKQFDKAAFDIAGYGKSPSGKYPWLGEVFEYVVRTETPETQDEKMARLDRYSIMKFEELMGRQKSPVISRVAEDYYFIRGTCCRDVTIFDDWYKARFQRRSSK